MSTTLETQKRIAARILKCGISHIWIDPDAENEVATAITSGDVRKFIGLGYVKKRPYIGISKARHRFRRAQVKKGRRRGHGSRTGASKARTPKKELWMKQIRAQRNLLKELENKKIITSKQHRVSYARLKAGIFKSKAHLLAYLKEQGIKFAKKSRQKLNVKK